MSLLLLLLTTMMMLELSTIRRSSSGAAVVKGVGIHHRHRNYAAAGILITLAEGIRHDCRRRPPPPLLPLPYGPVQRISDSGFHVGVGDHSCKANNQFYGQTQY